jgi:hypothetical protein
MAKPPTLTAAPCDGVASFIQQRFTAPMVEYSNDLSPGKAKSMKLPLMLAAILIPATAFAQGLPNWDINTYCTKRAQKSGMMAADLLGACVEAEQASLAELKEAWNGYTAIAREKCLKMVADDRHYADLQACIIAAEAVQHSEKR